VPPTMTAGRSERPFHDRAGANAVAEPLCDGCGWSQACLGPTCWFKTGPGRAANQRPAASRRRKAQCQIHETAPARNKANPTSPYRKRATCITAHLLEITNKVAFVRRPSCLSSGVLCRHKLDRRDATY
jgi:hypothetical protein